VLYRILADLLVVVHFGFVLFVVLGGLLVLRWPRLLWVHLAAVAWGAAVELAGWICPLTPWENRLRLLGGEAAYRGDFLARYVLAALYPQGLTRGIQVGLGVAVIAVNLAIYRVVLARRAARRARPGRAARGLAPNGTRRP
jgi:hypothetical protein